MFRKLGLPAAIIAIAYANRTRAATGELVELVWNRANELGKVFALPFGGWLVFLAVLSATNTGMIVRSIVWAAPLWILMIALIMRPAAVPLLVAVTESGDRGKSMVTATGKTLGWVLCIGWLITRLPLSNNPWVIIFVPPLMLAGWLVNMDKEAEWVPKIKRIIVLGITVDVCWQLAGVIFGTTLLEQWEPPFWAIASGVIVLALLTNQKTNGLSPAKQTPKENSGCGPVGTLLVIAAIGAFGWFIVVPMTKEQIAKEAAAEQRKLPVTLACDPTKYNTELLSGRKANEWVTVYIQPGCAATEIVAINYGKVLGIESPTDTEMRIFGPDGNPFVIDKKNSEGWFLDNPTKQFSLPRATAIQLRNIGATTTKVVYLRVI